MKKHYLKVTNQEGRIVFGHISKSPINLEKRFDKEAYDSNGSMIADFYFGKIECSYDRYLARTYYKINYHPQGEKNDNNQKSQRNEKILW